MRTILVTGATGLVGQFAAEELIRRQYTVRILVREASSAKMRPEGVEIAIGDLSDVSSLRIAAVGVSGIVHAACTFTDSGVDIAAMRALLDRWQQGPFVFVSSLDVYGLTDAAVITEEEPLSETYNDYAYGKVVCERVLREQAAAAGRSDFAILRAPYIWGPHPKPRERLVNARLRQGLPVVLPGTAEAEWSQFRDVWIDARDLAWIIAECLERPPGEALNVLSGHFCWHDLYAEIIRLTGSASTIVHKPPAEITEDELPNKMLYARKWRFSDRRLKERIGFVPRYSFLQTLSATLTQSASGS